MMRFVDCCIVEGGDLSTGARRQCVVQEDAATEKRGTDEANVTKIDHKFGCGQRIHECQSQAGIIQQVFEQAGEFFADQQDCDIMVWLLSFAGRNGHDRAFGIGYFADLSVAERVV